MIDTIISMGLITVIGGPVTLALVLTNFFGITRVNWYILVPFTAAYTIITLYILFFGVYIPADMLPALFSFIVICAILSLFLCIIVRRNYKWTFSDDKIFNLETTLKFIGSIVVTYGMAVFPFTGIYYFDPSLCKVRCKGYMLLGGTPPYVGSATASLIAFCAMPVVVYLFVVVRTKRNEENV